MLKVPLAPNGFGKGHEKVLEKTMKRLWERPITSEKNKRLWKGHP